MQTLELGIEVEIQARIISEMKDASTWLHQKTGIIFDHFSCVVKMQLREE